MINSISYNTNIDTYTKSGNNSLSSPNSIAFATSLQQRLGEATQSNVVAKADDPSLKDPYDVNQAINQAMDNTSQRQADRQQIENEARSFMFSAAYGQHQKTMLEQYIAASTSKQSNASLEPYEVYQTIQERQENLKDATSGAAQQALKLAIDNSKLLPQPEQFTEQQAGLVNIYA